MPLINNPDSARQLARAICKDLAAREHAAPDESTTALVLEARAHFRRIVPNELFQILEDELARAGLRNVPGPELGSPASAAPRSMKYVLVASVGGLLLVLLAVALAILVSS